MIPKTNEDYDKLIDEILSLNVLDAKWHCCGICNKQLSVTTESNSNPSGGLAQICVKCFEKHNKRNKQ